jgi:hypothetical protein
MKKEPQFMLILMVSTELFIREDRTENLIGALLKTLQRKKKRKRRRKKKWRNNLRLRKVLVEANSDLIRMTLLSIRKNMNRELILMT